MEHIKAHSVKLTDRTLWCDGDSTYDSSNLLNLVGHYRIKYVDDITAEVIEYNANVTRDQELTLKTSCSPLSQHWVLPPEYQQLDVIDYLFNKHDSMMIGVSSQEAVNRERRLMTEIIAFDSRNFMDVLRTLIYVINTLSHERVVWGVGRGSSVSSYALYVIGVHDVDSYEYELDINDFLHD